MRPAMTQGPRHVIGTVTFEVESDREFGGSGVPGPTVRTLPPSALDELLFFLRTGLTYWSTPATGGEPLDRLAMAALESDPDAFVSLSGPYGGGPTGGLSALLHRPVDEVRPFVDLLLDPGLQPGGSAREELRVAIGDVAGGLSDSRGFLVATAEALLSESAIDLEELTERSLRRSGAPEGEEVSEGDEVPERPAGVEPPKAPVPPVAPSIALAPAPTSAPAFASDLLSASWPGSSSSSALAFSRSSIVPRT